MKKWTDFFKKSVKPEYRRHVLERVYPELDTLAAKNERAVSASTGRRVLFATAGVAVLAAIGTRLGRKQVTPTASELEANLDFMAAEPELLEEFELLEDLETLEELDEGNGDWEV